MGWSYGEPAEMLCLTVKNVTWILSIHTIQLYTRLVHRNFPFLVGEGKMRCNKKSIELTCTSGDSNGFQTFVVEKR